MGSQTAQPPANGGRGALALMTMWALLLVAVWVSIMLVMVSRGLYNGA
jgi:hypothetical protein